MYITMFILLFLIKSLSDYFVKKLTNQNEYLGQHNIWLYGFLCVSIVLIFGIFEEKFKLLIIFLYITFILIYCISLLHFLRINSETPSPLNNTETYD